MKKNNINICVVGLGYVGLPLSVEFSKKYKTVGFDINSKRINELKKNIDSTKELSSSELKKNSGNIFFSEDPESIKDCNIYIITVPTPVNRFKSPDLSYLKSASKIVANYLNTNDIVIYESTVYPGCTEEDCVPVLEEYSGLKYNKDFYCGYSPERINPGDKKNKLTNIKKVTSIQP